MPGREDRAGTLRRLVGRFEERGVADSYRYRLPYPAEAFDVLLGLLAKKPRIVLDIGTGTGEIARGLVERVERVDAVDISLSMIAEGKALPNGSHERLRWIEGRLEDVPLGSSYSLITAGSSLHWMDWEVVIPRLSRALSPGGSLAILHSTHLPVPWQAALLELTSRYSTVKELGSCDLVEELPAQNLFRVVGQHRTAPVLRRQSVTEYVASFHSRPSLSLEHMSEADRRAFDQGVRDLVTPWNQDGILSLWTVTSITWGTPLA